MQTEMKCYYCDKKSTGYQIVGGMRVCEMHYKKVNAPFLTKETIMQTETEQKTIVDYLRDKVHHSAKTGRDTYVKNALDELLDQAKKAWLSQLRKEIEVWARTEPPLEFRNKVLNLLQETK